MIKLFCHHCGGLLAILMSSAPLPDHHAYHPECMTVLEDEDE